MKIKHNYLLFKSLCLALLLSGIGVFQASAQDYNREFYELRIYHLNNKVQQDRVEKYLKDALLPALHRAGINRTGVLRTFEGDTTGIKLYVLIPYETGVQLLLLPQQLQNDKQYETAGSDYLNATFDNPPYSRFENVLMTAFDNFPVLKVPKLETPKSERYYELRSYESATEKIHQGKVEMFNKGGEIDIFKKIEANPVFWGEVISGSHMPNLMYLTTYANKADREAHWKVFKNDPDWKRISALPENKNNVSHADILFLQPTDYSDL